MPDDNNKDDNLEGQTSAVQEFLQGVPTEGKPIGMDDQEEAPSDSPTDEKEDSPVVEDKAVDEKEPPFHKHPRFKQLTDENRTMKEKLDSLTETLNELREQKAPKDESVPPEFAYLFGDNKEAWQAYRQFDDKRFAEFKNQVIQELQGQQQQQEQQSQYWDNWVKEQTQELRDEGKTFDQNKLYKLMAEYKPTDDEGNLDFRKGYALYEKLESDKVAEKKEKADARKKVASQTTSSGTGEAPKTNTIDPKTLRRKSFHDLVHE